jgi:hypothetical protein
VSLDPYAPIALSGYDRMMIKEEGDEISQENDTTTITSDKMSEALDAMKAAAPSLAGALDASGVSPGGLAGSHERATSDAAPAADEGNERA